MQSVWKFFSSVGSAIRNLVGNNTAATIGIFLFIFLFVLAGTKCHGAELDLRTGVQFGGGGTGAVLGTDVRVPLNINTLYWVSGVDLIGKTSKASSNWDWHTGIESCRGNFCATLGASYLQNIDNINGAHTNFSLGLSYRFGGRVSALGVFHLSDAGTTKVNIGRQWVYDDIALQK
jgi:hypothetical protein